MRTYSQTDTIPGSARVAPTAWSAGAILERARPLALLGGGALLATGIRRRSIGGALLAAIGGILLYRTLRRPGAPSVAEGNPERTPELLVKIKRTLTIMAPADRVYATVRSPDTLRQVGAYIADISPTGRDTVHVSFPDLSGSKLALDLMVHEERPGEQLQWRSLSDAPWLTTAEVLFRPAPAGRGTETTLHIRFVPPAGQLGAALARRVSIVPDSVADTFLHRLKSLVETGEIPTADRRGAGGVARRERN